MVKVKHCRLIGLLLSTIILTGCNTLDVYTVVGVNNDAYTVCKDELCYTHDGELSTGFKDTKYSSNVLPLDSYTSNHALTFEEHCKYNGSFLDAVGYRNLLVSKGFKEESVQYTSNYLDTTLASLDGDTVRILYLGNQTVRVFYKSTENKNVFPPYIFEEE